VLETLLINSTGKIAPVKRRRMGLHNRVSFSRLFVQHSFSKSATRNDDACNWSQMVLNCGPGLAAESPRRARAREGRPTEMVSMSAKGLADACGTRLRHVDRDTKGRWIGARRSAIGKFIRPDQG